MSFESLIGQALLGNAANRGKAPGRIAVKAAVQRQCVCKCGRILDQRTAALFEATDKAATDSNAARPLVIVCGSCFESRGEQLQDKLIDAAWSAGLSVWRNTWRDGAVNLSADTWAQDHGDKQGELF